MDLVLRTAFVFVLILFVIGCAVGGALFTLFMPF